MTQTQMIGTADNALVRLKPSLLKSRLNMSEPGFYIDPIEREMGMLGFH
jgi:hypothetical protein